MDINICIVYKEGDRACEKFLAVYNKHVDPKVRKYRLRIPIISVSSLTQGQMKLLGKWVQRGVFPFAYVGYKRQHEVYTSMDQVVDIIIAKIQATKNDSDRGRYVNRVSRNNTDDIEDFLESERLKAPKESEAHDIGMGGFDERDGRVSTIISQIPKPRVNPRMQEQYSSGMGADFNKRGDFDPIEKQFVKETIDADKHDADRFIFETFHETIYDPDQAGSESRVSADSVGDRLHSRLSDIIAGAR